MMSRKYVFIPVLVTLVVLAVALYPTANVTQRASAAPRAAVVTKYLMIPAAAFTPLMGGLDYIKIEGGLRLLSGSSAGDFTAPVYLPSGARIRLIKLFASDSNTSYNVTAYLRRFCPNISSAQQLTWFTTTGSGGYQQTVKYYSHYVKWYCQYQFDLYYPTNTDLKTYGVMIRYTVNQ
jgi:hypothetical protein